MASHKVYRAIVDAVRTGVLKEPFTRKDFRRSCPGFEQLARSSRPGYPSQTPTREEVDAWVEGVRRAGIRSIIWLLREELALYDPLRLHPEGLLGYYRTCGFNVRHVPVKDFETPPLTAGELERVAEASRELPKPVLVHCSAGISRTGAAVSFLVAHLAESPNGSPPNTRIEKKRSRTLPRKGTRLPLFVQEDQDALLRL